VTRVSELTPALLQTVLRRSLASPALTVSRVRDPEELGGVNTNYGSDLRKLVVTVQEAGQSRDLHLVAKAALQSWAAWANVWFNVFIFYREAFWFSTALPELSQLVTADQAASLAAVVPRVHLAYCNYQDDDMARCFVSKPKEKGVILMENLAEGGEERFVDMKEIERVAGGGVKTAHMRMLLEALAHFHGAWLVWLGRGAGLGTRTREQVLAFLQQKAAYQYKWMWKIAINKAMNKYSLLAAAQGDLATRDKVEAFRASPESVDRFMKAFDYKDSKFQTVCHSDFQTSQIMYSLNEDGSPRRVKILDFQGLTLGHPAQDIWTIVYASTDPAYRAASLEADLRAYYAVLATYMEAAPAFEEFMQEVEERRVYGMVLFSSFVFVNLSPVQLPSPAKAPGKFSAAITEMLLAEEKEDDHPDIREIRRRVAANLKEMVDLGHI